MRVSGLSDEVTRDWQLEAGLDVLMWLGLKWVELRAADGQWLHDMDDATFNDVIRRVDRRGLQVSGLASKLGRAPLDEGAFEVEEADARRVLARVRDAGIPFVRVMGYGRGQCDERVWHQKTISCLSRMAESADQFSVNLILENAPMASQWTSSPDGCSAVMKAVNSPRLQMLFDPANFVSAGHDPVEAFKVLKPHIAYFHVKDLRRVGEFCLPGDGICGIPEALATLHKDGFDGFVSLEPHLRHNESPHFSGMDFAEAARRLFAILPPGIKL